MYQILCEAIRARSVLKLSMTNGESRIVEPYRYGAKANGKEFLSAFHRAEAGAGQIPTSLKPIPVSEIASVSATSETFTDPKPGYNPAGDKRIPEVFAQL